MKTMTPVALRSVVAMAALLLLIAVPMRGQSSDAPQDRSDGIKVHGHWTIDVLNPDGSRVAHHEFENALQTAGALNLATFLARDNAPGLWEVLLYSPAGTPQCLPIGVPCILSENGYIAGDAGDLIVDVPSSGTNQGKLVLTGSFTSPDARSFIRAIAAVGVCPSSSPGCTAVGGGNFTLRDFTPISVQAGQIVQVTVVISFS